MREAGGKLQTAPVGDGLARAGRAMLPWSALPVAAVLSLAMGVALYERLAPGRSSIAPGLVRPHALSRESLLSLPLAAQGPVSAALGADRPAYRVRDDQGGLSASNPAQHLTTTFTRSAVSVSLGAAQVGLSLRATGYGSTLTSVAPTAPRAHGNRVVYPHPGVSEWYANGPLGLEQGFTIARAPAGHVAAPLTLSLAVFGNVQASLASGGQSIALTRAGKTVLRYTGLSATDARGHLLRSWLELQGARLLLHVDATGARYPLRIDPFVQQGEKLTGGGEVAGGAFGDSVALSSDGDTALIGGDHDSGVGAAWVFTRSGSTWSQQGGKLTASGEIAKGYVGDSVALSSDGNTALIGGDHDNGEAGAAWVFKRSGSTWSQQGGKLTGSGKIGNGHFGHGVALSSDGNTALIGGDYDNKGIGAAWVFTRSGSTWTQQGEKLTARDEIGKGLFGSGVALSSDGDTALIGGPHDGGELGAAWVFTRAGETWTQHGGKLTASGKIADARFGYSVALSAQGDTAVIGGPHDNTAVGAAWVFTRSGETWNQQKRKLTANGGVGRRRFGGSVALSSAGDTALIGGEFDSGEVGAAWVFVPRGRG
jgi:hypothetical protein